MSLIWGLMAFPDYLETYIHSVAVFERVVPIQSSLLSPYRPSLNGPFSMAVLADPR